MCAEGWYHHAACRVTFVPSLSVVPLIRSGDVWVLGLADGRSLPIGGDQLLLASKGKPELLCRRSPVVPMSTQAISEHCVRRLVRLPSNSIEVHTTSLFFVTGNLHAMAQASNATGTAHQIVTLRQMADATLGRPGSLAVSFVYLPLSFSLLTAYIVKVGQIRTHVRCHLNLTAEDSRHTLTMRTSTITIAKQGRFSNRLHPQRLRNASTDNDGPCFSSSESAQSKLKPDIRIESACLRRYANDFALRIYFRRPGLYN
jgi:hypothetical protein